MQHVILKMPMDRCQKMDWKQYLASCTLAYLFYTQLYEHCQCTYVPKRFTDCSVQNFKGNFLNGPSLNIPYNLLFQAVLDTVDLF